MRLRAEIGAETQLLVNNIEVHFKDVITMDGLENIASIMGSPFNFSWWMPFIGVGSGMVNPSTEDKHLEREIWRKKGDVSGYWNQYIVHTVFGINEPGVPTAPYILREVGLFNKIVGGKMAARWVTTEDILVWEEDEVDVTCRIYLA